MEKLFRLGNLVQSVAVPCRRDQRSVCVPQQEHPKRTYLQSVFRYGVASSRNSNWEQHMHVHNFQRANRVWTSPTRLHQSIHGCKEEDRAALEPAFERLQKDFCGEGTIGDVVELVPDGGNGKTGSMVGICEGNV
ncbi:hypothetical protein BSKO_14084 [Bryopsis sp. KO-2023]|nr:hypothetical protein BSKO_14084 [Bryopsis sp. KO-2023]